MRLQDSMNADEAPVTATLYALMEGQRAEMRLLRKDAKEQLGDDLTPHQRAILLEAETDSMWHVFDAFLEAVHKLETGRGFTSALGLDAD